MSYTQDKVSRSCVLCLRSIEEFEQMLDLFRSESAVEGSGLQVLWCHELCAKKALQKWYLKKLERESGTKD